MRNKNTMDMREFLLCNFYWGFILMMVYHNLLFRNIAGMGFGASRLLLFGIAAGFIGAGILITGKRRRNGLSIAVNVLFPYELYGFLTYRTTLGSTMLWVTGISLGLSALYFLTVMTVSGADRKNRYPFRACLRHSLLGARTVLVTVFLLCWIPVLTNAILGSPLFSANSSAVSHGKGLSLTIGDCLDTVRNLDRESWDGLSLQERLDTLQTVADIERSHLGLTEALSLGAEPLEEGVAACYDDNTRRILVSLDRLEQDDPLQMLNSVCHEVFHAYQHRLCDVWRSTEESCRDLACFRDVEDYITEFTYYPILARDDTGYYAMTCEKNAREYAAEREKEYGIFLDHCRRTGTAGNPA